MFPGFDGGAEWGGSAYDPASGRLFVNANDLAWTGALAPDDGGTDGRRRLPEVVRELPPRRPPRHAAADSGAHQPHAVGRAAHDGDSPGRRAHARLPQPLARGRAGPGRLPPGHARPRRAAGGEAAAPRPRPTERLRFTGYKKFLDPDGYPAVAPPWGTLSAIDLHTGAYAWKIPLGEYPELVARGMADTGSENYGGPIVTAGGVLFIGATNFDKKFRAFDAATGRLLWQVTLPFAANTTPATYEADGRQYVVVAAGGGKSREPSGGMFIAYRLRRDAQRGR